MTQNNLAVTYSHRIADDRRLNQERAIACYEAALKAFTRELYPMEWASIQQNLGTLFSTRLEGNSGINTESAIKHYEAALEVMAAQQALSERARTTANLASAYLDRVKGSRAANIQTAITLLEDALTVRKRDSNPSQWANLQELLGESYRELGLSQSVDATAQAVACYRAALAVYTRHTFPLDWGRVMNGLGLAWMDRQLGGRDNNLAKAAKCFRMALKACTASAAPIAHRRIALNLAEAEATLGRWEVAHAAYAQALSVERALFQAGIGIRGKDAAVTEAREAATRNGYALTHLSRLREAITALEHGRTRVLAQARLLASADPGRISNPSLRHRYLNARNTLREAYVALDVDGARADLAQRGPYASTAEDAYRTAQSAFDSLVAEIRAAHDPADFLDEAVDDELIARAVWNGSQKRAAVYLLATPWGGMALGVFPTESVESRRFRVAALELPQLTSVFVDDLLEVSVGDDATTIVGGYTWAQEFHGVELLLNDNADESRGETDSRGETIERRVEGMHGACERAHHSSALVDAVRHVAASAKLGPLLRQSIAELSIIDRRALNVMVGQAFLERELDRCLPQLCEVALTPIARWLRDNDITSVALIPCSALGVFPLATLLSSLMEADEVAGQKRGSVVCCGVSVTPNLRAIARPEHYDIVKRSGVYGLGDPTSSKQGGSLRWGNSEARAIAALGGMAHQFAVQQDANREWLLVTLRKALVIDIACHGEFDYQDPLRSRILLARGESVTLNDLLGGAADVHGLRLVMLSSCQSGVGDVRRTRDEMHSLAVGMLQAGAQAVLAALWPVDDRATFLLMTRFAHEWLHDMECPPALALARAQQWLRVQSFADLGGWESRLRGAMSVLDGDPIPRTYSPDEVEIRGLGYRLSLAEADQRIRDVADLKVAQGYAGLRPYEHPTHWAAFQVFGA